MSQVFKRAGKTGNVWYVRFQDISGKDVRKATIARTKREAEIILADIIKELDLGTYSIREKQRLVTFFEIAEDFLAYSKAHKRSYERDQRTIKILKNHFGNVSIIKILPRDVEQYITERKQTTSHLKCQIRPATINRELACLKSIFNRAMDNELADRNPVKKIKFFKENNKRDRVLNKDEFEKLLGAIAPHLKPILILAYHTGMRKGEILSLKWEQIDFDKAWINLHPEQTKTFEGRRIPLPSIVIEPLKQIPRNREIVFLYQGQPIKEFRNAFMKALEKANIENFRFHDLRHTFVTNMRRANKQDRAIMKITGHRTMSAFTRYDTVDEEDLRKVVGL